MSLRERYISDVDRSIVAPRELKDRFIGDLLAHFAEGAESGESEASVIRKLGDPKDVAAEFMADIKLNYAGFWIRTLAFLIDTIIILIPGVVVLGLMIAVPTAWKALASAPGVPLPLDLVVMPDRPILLLLILGFGFFMTVVSVLYFPLLEGLYGRTLGKRLLGLRVVRDGGVAIGMKEAFLRRISLYLDILPIDALFIPFNDKKQRAFDMVANTVVIRDRYLM